MHKQVKVVIGAGFGDEGKGLMTDCFASRDAATAIVVRFNGGAQAAHTVVTPEGKSHVFSHFGSATMSGVPSYLSSYFIANPLHYNREFDILSSLMDTKVPDVFIDPNCMVTTPYDMIINQIIEMLRGGERHGSCGYGINETIRRTQDFENRFALSMSDLYNGISLRKKLERIKNEYVPQRLEALGVTAIPDVFGNVLENEGLLNAFIADCELFLKRIQSETLNVLERFENIVFEGAQGLLLDQNSAYFPYVTHSNTGLKNVLDILSQVSWAYDLEVVYVTRCYLTRHGAGPFPTEIQGIPYLGVADPTNIPNDWQGTLRFGLLDLDSLKKTIQKDRSQNNTPNTTYSLAVTCLDQVDGHVDYISETRGNSQTVDEFLSNVRQKFEGFTHLYESWGRTRSTIKEKSEYLLGLI